MKTFKSLPVMFAVLFAAGIILMLAQAADAVVTITDDGGDCYQVGKWKANNRTCTLNTDVSVGGGDGIDIDGNDIRLLCKGHSIMHPCAERKDRRHDRKVCGYEFYERRLSLSRKC